MSAPIKNHGKPVAILSLAASLLAGCTVYEHDHHDHDHGTVVVEERHDYRPVPPPPPPPVYRQRTLIVEGRHLIEFRAPRPGVATIVDVDRNEDILTLNLGPGDHLTVDPDKNKVRVNDRKVLEQDLKSKHVFRIYFQEGIRH